MSKRKLLLADDSMTIQKVVNLTFADEGIEVFTVGNGNAAIEKLPEIQPDLVLADVHMPGLTGYEVCEQIRRNPQFADIPVMLLVGSFEPFDETEARRVGANDFLTKPFQSIRQLVQKVTTLLDSPKAEAATTASNQMPFATKQAETMDEPIELESKSDFESRRGELSLGDAGMDDEMIETSTGSSFNRDFAASPYNYQSSSQTEQQRVEEQPSSEIRRTTPLSFDDIQEMNYSILSLNEQNQGEQKDLQTTGSETDFQGEPQTSSANTDFIDTMPQFSTQEPQFRSTYHEQYATETRDVGFRSENEAPAAMARPILDLDFDDEDLLQIGDDEDSILDLQTEEPEALETITAETQSSTEPQNVQTVDFEILPPEQPEITPQTFDEQTTDALAQVGNQAISQSNLQFTPEVIEAIAQRVVEKLSDKVIEKIAWEIVPDRFDLIVRKHIEKREG